MGLLLSLQTLLYDDIIKSIILPKTSYVGITITSINPKNIAIYIVIYVKLEKFVYQFGFLALG